MAARKFAPLCAFEEFAQNGALRAAVISAEFLSVWRRENSRPFALLRNSRKTGRFAPLLFLRSSSPYGARKFAPLCAFEEFAQNGALRAAVISAEFLSVLRRENSRPFALDTFHPFTS